LDNPSYSIAIDPIEGTTPTAKGGYEAMSVIALANKDCFYKTKSFYMKKFAVGPKLKKYFQYHQTALNMTPKSLVFNIATALNKPVESVTACVLDRPRSNDAVKEFRETGCRIKFISDCDVTACIASCEEGSGIDFYYSIGGSPEAVIAAAAMKCMGGYLECREWDKEEGVIGNTLTIEDLAKGETMFVGTGITDGKLLKGVRFTENGPVTQTIAMRSGSGTIRRIETKHGN
jgi:fructose-1,6-bisphosphatase II